MGLAFLGTRWTGKRATETPSNLGTAFLEPVLAEWGLGWWCPDLRKPEKQETELGPRQVESSPWQQRAELVLRNTCWIELSQLFKAWLQYLA